MKNWPIPLPPLAEQHRIVAKVNVLMALCDDLEARIRKRQEVQTKLLESVIAEMAIQA
ncbi:restriction endonuclease subunit S [Methanoculleus formosensis]|uniref:restriction endonuclease subunit S n=1 Tax=Methanoculleus formosensis TaxID=2590886 RepID=UPI0021C1FD5C|nr:restriction endonuclease subunit S [Methanoculleus sp. Afa-1]